MTKFVSFTIFVLLCCLSSFITAKEGNGKNQKYDISCAGTGVEGTYLANVSIYTQKTAKANESLKKAAVHGIIFKGVNGRKGCSTQRPLATDPNVEQEKAEFFDDFFKADGTYLQYATIIDGSLLITKTGKKEYCITATISIQKDSLRKYLEQEKIITGFSDIF